MERRLAGACIPVWECVQPRRRSGARRGLFGGAADRRWMAAHTGARAVAHTPRGGAGTDDHGRVRAAHSRTPRIVTTRRQTVLVTDGEHRAALAVVRSLGRAGHDVQVASPLRRSLAGASRYARGCHRVAEPLAEPDGFVDDVRRVIRERGVEVVIPITDAALFALLSRRDDLGDAVLPWPDEQRVRDLADKALVVEAAREVAI